MRLTVKICGITNPRDAAVAVEAGADWLGFVFYPPSPRYIEPAAARLITDDLPDHVQAVGVFVNEPNEQLRRIAEAAGLDILQVHGDESPEQLAELAEWQVIKALALRGSADLSRLQAFAGLPLLLDTPTPDYGGSGQVGDWNLAAEAARRHAVILAGGLTPDNVGAAIAAVRPAGVDVSSGVEASKGRKDHDKVRAFVAAARAALQESV